MAQVQILNYQAQYKAAFKELNEEWIRSYFEMEKEDWKTLTNPEEYILKKGGFIFFALEDKQIIGTCALIKLGHEQAHYELAKMAVSPKERGKGIGKLLADAVIEKAKALGARKLSLESNTKLNAAISLYKKIGFREVKKKESPYTRCNIQMELQFDSLTKEQ